MSSLPSQIQAPARSPHVLIVDDNEINHRVVSAICDLAGFTCEGVFTGHEAIRAVASGSFDLVLMDICMPEMDGIAASAGIRALGPLAARLPIIAVTANAEAPDRARYAVAGMCAVVSKPIHVAALCEAMQRAIADGDAAAQPDAEPGFDQARG